MALRALYLCNPEKNHECPKINCMMNPNAAPPCCYATSNPAAAALGQDGKPIELPFMEQLYAEIEHTRQGGYVMIRFDGVVGEAAAFTMKPTETGYECFLNGQKIPAVLSEKLVIGEGVPKVVLEIAVKEYSGKTRTTAPKAKIQFGIQDGRSFFKDSLAAIRDRFGHKNSL